MVSEQYPMSDYSFLKQHMNTFSYLNETDWLMVEPYLSERQFRKNEYYLYAGDIELQIGYIVQGSFRWYYMRKDGEAVNFNFSFEKDFVVEYKSFISQTPSLMYIQAMEDTTVILFPKREQIWALYAKSHNWSEFGRKVAQYVFVLSAHRVEELLFNTAEERYKSLLEKYPDIFQRVSLGNISSFIGIKGPSLSRIRKRLSKQ
jgi:CRP-like cAMP-binding protein